MNARKLVGMTMGARKRAARNEDDYTRSAEYLFQRTKYRIGQRLRPCPGCHGCRPGEKGWHIDKVRGRFTPSAVAWCCDGSGVIPAKARKVR